MVVADGNRVIVEGRWGILAARQEILPDEAARNSLYQKLGLSSNFTVGD
jgi:hypothetical protein